MTTLDPRALKACPFCGKEPILIKLVEDDDFDRWHKVMCEECGIEMGEEYRSDAIEAWNRRAPSQDAGEPVAFVPQDALNRLAAGESVVLYAQDREKIGVPLYASPQPALAVEGVTDAMVEAARNAADDALWKWRGIGERKEGEGLDGMHFVVRAALTAALVASPPPSGAVEDGQPCEQCGRPSLVWFAPNKLWNLVMGGPDAKDDPGGHLCPYCFIIKAEKSGVRPTAWKVCEEVLPVDAALSSAPATADGWRTMDSAPKDGTKVDLWCRAPGLSAGQARVTDCWFSVGKWWRYDEHGDDQCRSRVHNATHWRPLPAAPTATGGR